eukprot:5093542-Amphidinium_carterae.1
METLLAAQQARAPQTPKSRAGLVQVKINPTLKELSIRHILLFKWRLPKDQHIVPAQLKQLSVGKTLSR